MDHEAFRKRFDQITHGRTDMIYCVVAIIFHDGERHLAFAWTFELGTDTVQYLDVHSKEGRAKTEISYTHIKDVQDYGQ